MKYILLAFLLIISSSLTSTWAAPMVGRLGLGMSKQVVNDMDLISIKIQRSRAIALGGFFGLDTGKDQAHYTAGAKLYRIIYDEPQLNFYMAGSGALFSYNDNKDDSANGYQLDGVFGTEFNFQGLESIGFSFEFGASLYKYNEETHFGTVGYDMLRAAIHFYL
jgi:hypothetical protein